MKKISQLFTRQSLLCTFLIVFMAFMTAFTSYNILLARRNAVKNIYNKIALTSSNTALNIAKTCIEVLDTVDDFVPVRQVFITAYGMTQRVICNNYVYDPANSRFDVIKLSNGSLCFLGLQDDSVGETASYSLTKLKGILDKTGTSLLYITTPYKTNPDSPGLQPGIDDYQNDKIRSVHHALSAAGIDNLCLTDCAKNQKLDFSSMFFKTDHHWTPSTALMAAQTVSQYLNNYYGFKIDLSLLEKRNFNSEIYKSIFLVSQGKKVGPLYCGVDDFELLIPKYETNMTCKYLHTNNTETTKNGSFEETQIFRENLAKNYFYYNVYMTYSGGDYKKTYTLNRNIADNKRILLVRDSFSCTFAPFLSLVCKELYTIDLRHSQDLIDYIMETDPDIVVYLEYPFFEQINKVISFD